MKHYCLNKKAKQQIKESITKILLSMLLAFVIISGILSLLGLFILPNIYFTKGISAFTSWDYFVMFMQAVWLLLGILQLGKWFITNLEEC